MDKITLLDVVHLQQWKLKQYPALIENALRHLIAISPDLQTS